MDVGPFLEEGAVEALDRAVGEWGVGSDSTVLDPGERSGEFGARVVLGVICEHSVDGADAALVNNPSARMGNPARVGPLSSLQIWRYGGSS